MLKKKSILWCPYLIFSANDFDDAKFYYRNELIEPKYLLWKRLMKKMRVAKTKIPNFIIRLVSI